MKCLKRLCVVIGVTFCSLPMFSQEISKQLVEPDSGRGQTFMRVEKMPEYPGGTEALMKFVAENIKYPQEAIEKGYEGLVVVRFVVDKTGKVINPQLLKSGGHSLLDKAAMDVILLLPNFTPGEQAGEKVSVYYNLPVRFALPRVEKKEEN